MKQHVDEKSGLVYNEVIVKAPDVSSRWIFRSRLGLFTDTKAEKYRNPYAQQSDLGARSLYMTAKLCVLSNVRLINPMALEKVPEHLAEDIWDTMSKGEHDSVYAWQLFRAAHPHSTKIPLLYRTDAVSALIDSLDSFLRPTWDVRFDCVTSLDLVGSHVTNAELVRLEKVPNLVALCVAGDYHLAKNRGHVNLKVLRAWSESAQSGGFPKLVTLQVQTTGDIFDFETAARYLAALPVLEWLTIGPRQQLKMNVEGWSRELLQKLPPQTEGSFAERIYSWIYHEHQQPRLPLLSVRILPRPLSCPPPAFFRRVRDVPATIDRPGPNPAKRRKVSCKLAQPQQVGDALTDFGT